MDNKKEYFVKSNVVNKETTERQIENALEEICNTVAMTLGPFGSTTMIQDRQGKHFMTKDGYTVLKHIYFVNDIPRTVLDTVMNVSKALVKTVGDGSTSSVLSSFNLYKGIKETTEKFNVPPQDIISALKKITEIISSLILIKSNKIDDDNFDEIVKKIAKISTNNDEETAEFILSVFKAVGRHCQFILTNSGNKKDSYMLTSGMDLPRGYRSFEFANQIDGETCKLANSKILVCNGTIDEGDLPLLAGLMGKVCLNEGKALTIIANKYEPEVDTFFIVNKRKNRDDLQINIVDHSMISDASVDKLLDLAYMTGARVWSKKQGVEIKDVEELESMLGEAKEVISDELNTKIIEGMGIKEEIDIRIQEILEKINTLQNMNDHIDRTFEMSELYSRIAVLSNSMAKVFVGGDTEQEKETRKFLIEDAIMAVKSALAHGYIIGGTTIIPRIINEILTDTAEDNFGDLLEGMDHLDNIEYLNKNEFVKHILSMIKDAFLSVYERVLTNGCIQKDSIEKIKTKIMSEDLIYNLKTRKYEDASMTNIINSAQTDIEILSASISIMSLLATSNQVITVNVNA